MILVRHVFQAKYGRGDELVGAMKELRQLMPQVPGRLLTDLSGTFFTVVSEFEVASLAEWEMGFATSMRDQRFAAIFSKTVDLVDTGRREFYTIAD
jgi:hypothetical protein